MTVAEKLEDFTPAKGGSALKLLSEDALEDHRLTAFESGYTAGWEDALIAHQKDLTKVSKALSSGLEDAEYTYAEAVNDIVAGLNEFFETLIGKLLPTICNESIGIRVKDLLLEATHLEGESSISVSASPADVAAIQAALSAASGEKVNVSEDTLLNDGEVQFRLDSQEYEIDTFGLVEEIRKVLKSLSEDNQGARINA